MGSKLSSGRRKESKNKQNDEKKLIRERLRLLKKKSSRETARLNANGLLFLFLLGDKNTGKTSLLNKICPSSSVQYQRIVIDVDIKGHKFKSIIRIHDRRQMMTKMDGVLLLYERNVFSGKNDVHTHSHQHKHHRYDSTNLQTFKSLKLHFEELLFHCSGSRMGCHVPTAIICNEANETPTGRESRGAVYENILQKT